MTQQAVEMSTDNPFIPSLGKLALSLGASESIAASNVISPQLSQRRQICVVTLLRIIDNILDDPNQLNPKVRKIKVNNPAFHKRCGQWNGTIDYLLKCGFRKKGNQNNSSASSATHLKLDADNRELLFYGREMLVQFAVLTLSLDETSLPKCPTQENVRQGDTEENDDNVTMSADGSKSRKIGASHSNIASSAPTSDVAHDDNSTKQSKVTATNEEQSTIPSVQTTHKDLETKTNNTTPQSSITNGHNNNLSNEDTDLSTKLNTLTNLHRRKSEQSTVSADELMTDLLDEIEAELNDDFFSPATSTSTIDKVVPIGDTSVTGNDICDNDVSPKDNSISMRSSEEITSNIDENDLDLEMAIAMSLSTPDSDKENDEMHTKQEEDISKSSTLTNGGVAIAQPQQKIDPETSSEMVEETLHFSEESRSCRASLVSLEEKKTDEQADASTAVSDNDEDSVEEKDDVQPQNQNEASRLNSEESDTLNTTGAASADVAGNDRMSLLRTSISSMQTLQIKNTSVKETDMTDVEKIDESIELDTTLAIADDQRSQYNDSNFCCNNRFQNISIPDGEDEQFSNKDVDVFRLGFELCYQSLISVFLSSDHASVSGVSNLKRLKNTGVNVACDPVILIPLHLAYAAWAHILGLQSKSPSMTSGAQAGSLYSWIATNNNDLSTLDDIIQDLSMNIHTNLSESCISVCNYVVNVLRGVNLAGVYGGCVKDSPPSDTTFFIGIERSTYDEYTNNSNTSSHLSETIVNQCHDILAQVVYPPVYDQLHGDGVARKTSCDHTLSWYAAHHISRHLMSIQRIEDVKGILLSSNFIRARIKYLGDLEGTRKHCKECDDVTNCILTSKREWKRKQLTSIDTKREECFLTSEDYEDYNPPQQAPELLKWRENHLRALCAVSNILRERIGHTLDFDIDAKVEVGNSLQAVAEAIGEIGFYRKEELEHYDEALQLKSEALGESHEEVADTLFSMGCHHQLYQHYAFARKCYEQALSIYKARFGYDDTRVARVLHNIGVMYHSKKEVSVAMKCFTKSLSIRIEVLGENDVSVAESHCWIGNMQRESEEFEAARESFLAAYAIKSQNLGDEHLECAEILHNIGVVCDDLGLYSESLSSFREALMIRKKSSLSTYDLNEMSDICDTLSCIANVYRAKMDRHRALQFFEQSLKRRAKVVSAMISDKEQVQTLLDSYEDVIALLKTEVKVTSDDSSISERIGSYLFEMAILYDQRLNKLTEALTYFQKALHFFRETKDTKKIGQVLTYLASIYIKKGDSQKALKCYRGVLRLDKKSSDGDSIEIADTLHNIGNCEAKEGEFGKCLITYTQSLHIKMKLLHGEHLSIAKTEHCIGLAQIQVGSLDKALASFLSSMKTRRSLLGNEHLDVSFSLHSIGRVYFYQERYDEAIENVKKALEIKEKALHDKHISVAESQHLLGSLLIKCGDFPSALPLLKSALMTYKGEEDCEVMKSDVLDLLATAYVNKGDHQYAILSLEQSLKIKTDVLGPDDLACANVLMILGKEKAEMENYDGALVAFKEVKRIQKQVYGKEHLKNADLLVEVAAIQNKLGNTDMAFRCYSEALRIRQSQLYINSPKIAEVLVCLGKIHQTNDDHVSAMDCFGEAVDIYSKKEDCSELADVHYLLGKSHLAKGDSIGGLKSLEKSLHARETSFGTDSIEWAEVAYDVGIAKLEVDPSNGVSLLEKFVRIARTSDEIMSEKLSNALVEIGKIYRKTRGIDEAMELFDEALKMRNQDENELWMSDLLLHKGNIFESRKQYLKSLSCYEESLQLRKSVAGEDEVAADTMKRLGEIHRLRCSYDQALEQFESALEVYRMNIGNDHASVADTLHGLGYVHDAKSDVHEALKFHKEAWNIRKNIFGKDHVKVASSLDDIAGTHQKAGDNVKAIRCLKEALRIRKLKLGNDDMEVATTLFGLGICCAAINETPKAMDCYERALRICAQDGSNPKLEAQALHQIGCVHASNCSYREALQSWRTSLSKYREAGLADEHYMVACTLGNIEMAENVLSSG